MSPPSIPNVEDRPELSELSTGKIHVWYACVDCSPKDIKEFETVLSREETARARRFRSDQDRDRYIVQHGVLRSLLAGYLSCGFDQVDIRSSAHGKPYLAGKDSEGSLQFSLSHSGAYAALAFGRCNSIGVDIEEIREIPELEGIVDQHFTPREKAEMLACQIDWKLKTFYRLWTRKEAVLKAQGEGLLRELDNVDVATGKESGIWKACIKQGSVVEEYSFTDIDGPQGYEAAVAVAGPIGPKSVQLYFMGKV